MFALARSADPNQQRLDRPPPTSAVRESFLLKPANWLRLDRTYCHLKPTAKFNHQHSAASLLNSVAAQSLVFVASWLDAGDDVTNILHVV